MSGTRSSLLVILLVLLLPLGCREGGADQVPLVQADVSLTTTVHHEPGCPILVTEVSAARSDSVIMFSIAARSLTKVTVASFVLRCSLEDRSGEVPRPVGRPFELKWIGSLAPSDSVEAALSSVLPSGDALPAFSGSSSLVAQIEPESVVYEGGGEWRRTGPVPQ